MARRTKRKYTISEAVKNRKPKVAFTGYSYIGGLKVSSIVYNKYRKGTISEESLIKNIVKHNGDKMNYDRNQGGPDLVIRSALKVTDSRQSMTDRLAYLEEQSRRLTFWNENENREERSYRASLMSAMSKMRKQDLQEKLSEFGSTIDLENWTYSESEQGMVYFKEGQMYVLGFDSEFDGNYESNVLSLKKRDLPGGIRV